MGVKCRNCPIRKLPLFDPMTSDEVEFMEHFKVGELSISPGAPILSEGGNTPQIYTALSGMGLRYKLLEDGRRQVISLVLPGDFIGLQAGVMNQMTHSVEATTSMRLCVFDRSELWNLFRTQPERAFDLTWLAANEERFLGEALAALGQRDAYELLAWALARIWRKLEALQMINGDTTSLPYRQQDLADAMGLSLVHTNKTLAKLRAARLAIWADGKLTVPDIEELEEAGLCRDTPLDSRPLI